MSNCDSPKDELDTRAQLLELYTRLANEPASEFGWASGRENSRELGYAEEWLNRLPQCVWESAAAVGNPFSLGPVQAGETVVDVGCGAGADACVAALLVGKDGEVFGIDSTPVMVDKAVFINVELTDFKAHRTSPSTIGAMFMALKPFQGYSYLP